jgi:transmembrane sensor
MSTDRIWILLTRKLTQEASATELQELELLLKEHPEMQQNAEQVSAAWTSPIPSDRDFLEATYLQHLERMKAKGHMLEANEPLLNEDGTIFSKPSASFFTLKKMLFAAATVVIIACTALWIQSGAEQAAISQVNTPPPSIILTPNGSRTKMLLPDGSNVWLNSGSKLTYHKSFETGLREVYLTGEAFFDVVKNPQRPFIIHTAKIDVKVLGTRFNVKAYENDKTIETSVIKGSVRVFLRDNPSNAFLLQPNQKLVLQNEERPRLKNTTLAKAADMVPLVAIMKLSYLKGTNTDIESSWTRNILSFEDEMFVDVAKKMERWYDINIEFKNRKWEQQYLSGSFEKESLEMALKALQFSTGFTYKQENKTISIY